MEAKIRQVIIVSLVGLVILGGTIYLLNKENGPGPLDSLAQCIKDSGTTFYGAFWCPHCQTQKAAFGASERLLPYVECSTPDGNSQAALCVAKGVKSYPTWVYPDGSIETGKQTPQHLAEKTGCEMPKQP